MAVEKTHLSPAEIAAARGIAVHKVLSWVHSGQLEAVDVSEQPTGRPRWRISSQALADFDARRSSRHRYAKPTPLNARRKRNKHAGVEFV